MIIRKIIPLFVMTIISVNAYSQNEINFDIKKGNGPAFERSYAGDQKSGGIGKYSEEIADVRKGLDIASKGIGAGKAGVSAFRDREELMQSAEELGKSVKDAANAVKGGFPNVDPGQIATAIVSTIMKISFAVAKEKLSDLKLKIKEHLAKLEAKNLINAAASFIDGRQKQNVKESNDRIAEQKAASPALCDQLANSIANQDTSCLSQDVAKNITNTRSYAAYVKQDDNVKNSEAAKLLYNIEKTHPSLFGVEDPEVDSGPVPEAYAINADPLMGTATAYKALSLESHEAMKDLISLIVPDPSMISIPGQLSLYDDFDMTELMSEEAKRSFSRQSLLVILGLRSSKTAITGGQDPNPTSRMFEFHDAIRTGVTESAMYKLSTGETSTPTRLYRTKLLSMVKALDLQLEQFKSQLRLEGQVAVKLASFVE